MVSRTEGNIDDFHIGGYASAEIPKGKAAERIVIIVLQRSVFRHHNSIRD